MQFNQERQDNQSFKKAMVDAKVERMELDRLAHQHQLKVERLEEALTLLNDKIESKFKDLDGVGTEY